MLNKRLNRYVYGLYDFIVLDEINKSNKSVVETLHVFMAYNFI